MFSSPTPDRSAIESAVAQANPSVLRMALYQATRDPELADMQVNQVPLRGGAFYGFLVDERHHQDIRAKAVDFLAAPTGVVDEVPGDNELRSMMSLMTGSELTDAEFRLGREELALDDFPREATWNDQKPEVPANFRVAVIGAGASGIAAAVQLERLGIPYDVYERQAEIGGTWHLNQYPEARVDTSSFLYQFKFVKNYPWPEYFASQSEVKRYLTHVSDTFGVTPRIQFGTALERAVFNESSKVWDLELRRADGSTDHVHANVIFSAAGQFSTPRRPDIAGAEDYAGDFFHTTAWDPTFDPAGKSIAIIGNGSTGVQLMPHLAAHADQVHVFQRTPQWISPMEGYRDRITDEIRWLFDHMPFYWNWYCYHTQVTTSGMQLAQEYDPQWQADGGQISARNDGLRANLTQYIQDRLGSRPDLIEKVLPDYAPLARRLVVDNGWYEALLRDNVDLETAGIERFTENSIITRDGREIVVDAVVFAGGFDVGKYLFPTEYVGRDGATMEQAWSKDGPRAYLGMTVPSFPNLFIFYGPNAQARSGAFLSWIEIWSRYAAQGVVRLLEGGHRAMEIRREVFNDYQDGVDKAHEGLIWQHEAPADRNYYVNASGRQIVNWPWRNEHYFELVATLDPDDYDFS